MSQPAYNHLTRPLKNHYIIARHGFSLANNEKLICSNPEIAIPAVGGPRGTGWGLHEKGSEQVKKSAAELANHLASKLPPNDKEPVKIFCSPFLRTCETAAIFRQVLNMSVLQGKEAAEPSREFALRERFFGEFDMTSDDNYHICWQADATGPDHGEHSEHGVESPSKVCERATRFIAEEIEAKMQDKIILLVAHGDICQILQTAFINIDAWRQREVGHIDTANWRDMLIVSADDA